MNTCFDVIEVQVPMAAGNAYAEVMSQREISRGQPPCFSVASLISNVHALECAEGETRCVRTARTTDQR